MIKNTFKYSLMAWILMALLVYGCASVGKFTAQGAQTANAIVTKAGQVLGIVQVLIPALQTLAGLPAFVDRAMPYLTLMQGAEQQLHTFINSHTAGEAATPEQEQQINTVETQVAEAQAQTTRMQMKLNQKLQAENRQLRLTR